MAPIKLTLYSSSSVTGESFEKQVTIFLLKFIWLKTNIVCPECLIIQSLYCITEKSLKPT
jgi:hypothetical protein